LTLAGITVLFSSAYIAYLVVGYRNAIAEGATMEIPEDVSERYNVIANTFDSSVDWTESLMGINRLRKKMAQQATGDVCEVSIGTGRNLSFYDWNFKGFNGVGKMESNHTIKTGKVKSFTAVDKSAQMLEMAHDKFAKDYPGIVGVKWVVQDAAQPLPPPTSSTAEQHGKKYDTIIQTMGLCSTNDPVGLLKNLGESVEWDGRILLLEHGRGTWDWINTILDGLAPRHAREFGCVWNKDIGQIVKESGLDVVKMERKHFGTTWWIELTPRKRAKTDTVEASLSAIELKASAKEVHGRSKWFWSS
jgi:methyltransferase OMS1